MDQEYRVRLTPQALTDLDEIYAFVLQDSPQNAASIIERIFDSIDRLGASLTAQSSNVKYPH